MEIGDLRAFVRIAELSSLSAAARAMKVPKSALSRALGRLEQPARAAQFARSTRPMRKARSTASVERRAELCA